MSNQPQRGDKSPHDAAVTTVGEYIGPLGYIAVASAHHHRKSPATSADRKCGMHRESLERFRLRCAQLAGVRADLIFEREGLGWRLVEIDLPDSDGAKVS